MPQKRELIPLDVKHMLWHDSKRIKRMNNNTRTKTHASGPGTAGSVSSTESARGMGFFVGEMGQMKASPLSIDLLKVDGNTQNRLEINEDAVQDYADVIAENNGEWPLGPLDVFHDGNDYLVADGFHRTLAAQRAERASIPCRIHKGTARDARIFGMTANDRHGLRMTRADKRACVEWLLNCGEKMTQNEIAEKSGVTRKTVQRIVADRKKPDPETVDIGPPKNGTLSQHFGGGSATESFAPGTMTEKTAPEDYGKCPNCLGTTWEEDEDGVFCARCRQSHGEPTGGVDEDRIKTQRQKTVKTVEALQRAFDDLHILCPQQDEHATAVAATKRLLEIAREWT